MPIRPENLFAVVIALMDGILTALTLAAAKIVETGDPLTISMALRIAAAAAGSGACVFFVAEYARLRRELVRSEQHLSLRSHGQLAMGRLGRAVVNQTAGGAAIACTLSFFGALFPLLPAALYPKRPWLALIAGLIGLALLGVCLARVVFGGRLVWAAALVLAGVGIELHIV